MMTLQSRLPMGALTKKAQNDNGILPADRRPQSAIPTPTEGLITDREWSRDRRKRIQTLAEGIRSILGTEWVDYTWPSPGEDFVNCLPEDHHRILSEAIEKERTETVEVKVQSHNQGEQQVHKAAESTINITTSEITINPDQAAPPAALMTPPLEPLDKQVT